MKRTQQLTTPVTTLKRKATEVIADLQKHRQPVLITEHGQPSAYLIDVDSYWEEQDRIEVLLAIMEGEAAVARGEVYDHEEVMAEIDKKFGFPLKSDHFTSDNQKKKHGKKKSKME